MPAPDLRPARTRAVRRRDPRLLAAALLLPLAASASDTGAVPDQATTPASVASPSGPYALETVLGPSLDGPGDTSDVQVRFGDAVAIDGDWMLVGVPERRGAGGQVRGAAFVFRRDAAGEWETHQFLQFGAGGDARCGAAVALSGRHAVIGCPGYSSEGLAERGRTLVYYRNDDGLYVDPVTFLGSQAGARCGHAVAAASWIAVGCIGQNTTGQSPARGEVELYVQPELPPPFNPQLWINPGRLVYDANVVPGPAPFQMGFALAIDRLDGVDRIAVGIPGTVNNSGMVRVFRRNPGDGLNWTFEYAGSLPGGPQTDARFGERIALRGRLLNVGAPGADTRGRVHTYYLSPVTGAWSATGVIEPGTLPQHINSGFGSALAFNGSELWIGQPGWRDASLVTRGRVLRYRAECSGPLCVPAYTYVDARSYSGSLMLSSAEFGSALAADPGSGTLLIGAPRLGYGFPGGVSEGTLRRWGGVFSYRADRLFANGFGSASAAVAD
ncbi:MAG: hypothetical protein KF823_14280 [Xanthomonadales bacterium]|nr:hypothetical protein [Xanthomonadales bacterium]